MLSSQYVVVDVVLLYGCTIVCLYCIVVFFVCMILYIFDCWMLIILDCVYVIVVSLFYVCMLFYLQFVVMIVSVVGLFSVLSSVLLSSIV